MLAFLEKLIATTSSQNLIDALTHTAYDELMIINCATDRYTGRYHSDGKFFAPAMDNSFRRLMEYCSTHMVHPEDRANHRALMNPDTMEDRLARAKTPGILNDTIRYLGLDGNWHPMQHLLISGPEYGTGEHELYFYLFDIQDIRGREEGQHNDAAASTERLRILMPDLLTETTFFALAQERLHHLKGQWCMIAVDVKHFKLFKELNGQEKGDRLLIRYAERLHETAKLTDGLACYRGQDDFGLLVPFDQAMIDRLFSTLRQEIDNLSGTSGFYPIFGICLIYDAETSALDQFNHAALTAEEIKDDLQYHIRVYDPDTHERHVEEFQLLSDFREAIGKGEIIFHLQPQVNVESGRVVGAEALARWKKANDSYISPAVFVPVLEKYGIITDLDTYVWEQVCAWQHRMVLKGIKPVPVSLNVSRINIFSVDVPALLTELTERYELDRSLIEVEITESAYIEDEERIQNTVSELRKNGFRVFMDDFGSGYSSLNMLRNVSVDVIKLDAQFLRFSLGEEQKGINILESIINMTKSLSTPMIVEGVETPALVRYLKDMGIRYMQGFHYFRPMLPDQFESLISNPSKVDHDGIYLQRNEQLHFREFLDGSIYSDGMLNNILGPVAFYGWKDDNVDIVRFNSQFVHLIGLEAKVLEERRYHIQDFFYPDDRPKFFDMLREAREDRINGADGLFRVYNPDGTIFWIQLRVYYLRFENGQDLFYGSAADMTELQYLNFDLPGGYYRCAATDRYELLYTSRAFLDMLGYTREELKSLYNDEFARLIHPDDLPTVLKETNHASAREILHYTPYRVRHRDGHYLYVIDQCQLTDRYGALTWQAILVDVTEVMTLRNRMRLLQKYSTDCIVFIRRLSDPLDAEVAVYGLENWLHVDADTFRQELVSRAMKILDREGRDLYGMLKEHYESPAAVLNGTYTLVRPNGQRTKVHMRFDRIHDRDQEVECIIFFSPSTEQ